jgi:alkylhydroperoxidase family enzyme
LRARVRLRYHARMARLPYVDLESAPEKVRETMERLPVKLNVFRMMANADTCFRPLLQLGSAILGGLALPARLRELLILQVGKGSPAPYEWTQHVPIARVAGASDEQIAAVERGDFAAACFDARERAALRAGAELLRAPKLSDAAFAELERHFPPREIVEILVTVGYYMMLARLLESTAVDIDPPAGTAVIDSIS